MSVVVDIFQVAQEGNHLTYSRLPTNRNFVHGGSTDISAGYLMGLRELTRVQAAGGSTLLLISDGHANAGGGAHRFAATIDEAVGAIAAEVNDLLDKTIVNAVLRLTPTFTDL